MDRLLIVDDDASVQRLLRSVLADRSFEIDSAEDGGEALEMLRSSDYAAVLLDLLLPTRNGFEILREVKAHRPSLLRKIIICTAASEATLGNFSDGGLVFGMLHKPFDVKELWSSLQACLRQNGTTVSGLVVPHARTA